MRFLPRPWIALVFVGLAAGTWAVAQQTNLPPPTKGSPPPGPTIQTESLPPPPPASAVAATVNAQPITELSVYRLRLRGPQDSRETREDILNFLIETVLVDQFVAKFNLKVAPKEVEEKVQQMRDEAKKDGTSLEEILRRMHLSMEELRDQLTKGLLWDKFCVQQATEKNLRDFFDKNKNMFDGSQVHARHILVTTADKTPKGAEAAKTALTEIRKVVDNEVNKQVAKLPAGMPPLAKEKERARLLEQAFSVAAAKHSSCPSKNEGGDVGWFERTGVMVEPFARSAFALKPHEISEIVATEFGHHLIMAIDTKPGKQVRFEDVRPAVFEVYCERLRDAIVANQRPPARIEIFPGK